MEETPKANRAGLALAIAALLGVLVGLAALLDIGPFADEELTAEQFIAQGDEICREAHDEFLDLQDSPPRTPSDAAELTGGLIEVAEEERDAIRELNAPESLAEDLDAYWSNIVRGVNAIREVSRERWNPDVYFDPQGVTRLVEKCRTGRAIGFADNMAFVGILSTQLFHHQFIANRQHVTPLDPAGAVGPGNRRGRAARLEARVRPRGGEGRAAPERGRPPQEPARACAEGDEVAGPHVTATRYPRHAASRPAWSAPRHARRAPAARCPSRS